MCGRTVTRHSRQQRFCSDRCRDFARRENNACTAFKNPVVGEDTGKPTNPPKKSNGFKGLQAAKLGPTPRFYGSRDVICGRRDVIVTELFEGFNWTAVVSPDGVCCMVASRSRRRPRA
jgi:hypothetical protein